MSFDSRARAAAFAVVLAAVLSPPAIAATQSNPLSPYLPPNPYVPSSPNDLFALGQGVGDSPAAAPTQDAGSPPLTATPVAPCGRGSKPEPGVDGRVPAGAGNDGLWCNITEVAHQGTSGGFKVLRYIDVQGHECAFYDTALLFPTNAINPGGPSLGVEVLDMSDPAHPIQTDTLTAPSMLTPHESLVLNQARGLLAAVDGNPATEPGLVTMYDVHQDCRHPVLDFSQPLAKLGHESGFSMDGKTFYATATAYNNITAIDVSDPIAPHVIWQGNIYSHGMSLSDDGNRAYLADPTEPTGTAGLTILDTRQIQARVSNPVTREVARLTWPSVSIPQNAIPFSESGHPYLLEFDEYTAATLNPAANADDVGAGRIIDIGDETHPRVIANLRLAVDNPSEHAAAKGDPGTSNGAQGYAAHYCNIPSRVDPKIVACSFIVSGLRVFDISNLLHPKEIAYYVAPTLGNTENGYQGSDYAMSQPTIIPERHEIWYSDGGSGFYVLRVSPSVWPSGQSVTPPATPGCPHATGRLSGKTLGSLRLGMTRAQARHAFAHSSDRGKRYEDFFCLTPIGVRVGYPSLKLLATLPRRQRHLVSGRVIWASTSNPYYSLRGVRPGAALALARRRLRLGRGYHVGLNWWYFGPNGASRALLKVRHGIVQEIGIAEDSLTRTHKAQLTFVNSFS
jgi:hypothetical protein